MLIHTIGIRGQWIYIYRANRHDDRAHHSSRYQWTWISVTCGYVTITRLKLGDGIVKGLIETFRPAEKFNSA